MDVYCCRMECLCTCVLTKLEYFPTFTPSLYTWTCPCMIAAASVTGYIMLCWLAGLWPRWHPASHYHLVFLPMSVNSAAPSTPCLQCAHAGRKCRVRNRNVHCNRCLQKDLDCSFRRSKCFASGPDSNLLYVSSPPQISRLATSTCTCQI